MHQKCASVPMNREIRFCYVCKAKNKETKENYESVEKISEKCKWSSSSTTKRDLNLKS